MIAVFISAAILAWQRQRIRAVFFPEPTLGDDSHWLSELEPESFGNSRFIGADEFWGGKRFRFNDRGNRFDILLLEGDWYFAHSEFDPTCSTFYNVENRDVGLIWLLFQAEIIREIRRENISLPIQHTDIPTMPGKAVRELLAAMLATYGPEGEVEFGCDNTYWLEECDLCP